ncbi:O-antigen ligase family protein [Pseudoclavibacter endophyticus]|nr:O-antigen ligase family protein [Pseudoclavibacter endophyticus]
MLPPASLVWFLLWSGWLIVSSAWSSPAVNVFAQIEDVVLLVGVVLVVDWIFRHSDSESIAVIWWFLWAAALVYFVAAIASGPGDGPSGRFSAFGSGPNVFVRIMALGVVSSFALSLRRRRLRVLMIFAPIFGVGALLSGSRGGVLAVVVAFVIMLIPLVRRFGVVRCMVVGSLSIGAFALFLRLLSSSLLASLYDRYVVQPLVEGDTSLRDFLAEQAWTMFTENLWTGAGVGSFASDLSYLGEGYHAHNLVLSTLAETGIVGGGLLAVTLCSFVVSLFRLQRHSTDVLFLLMGAFVILVASMFSGDYYDTRFAWVLLVLSVTLVRREACVPLGSNTSPAILPAQYPRRENSGGSCA